MLRSIAPTQFVTSGNFVSPRALAAINPLDCFVLTDPEIHPIGPEIHGHQIVWSDHPYRPQKQRSFKGRRILSDQVGELRRPAGVFGLRRKRCLGGGATREQHECDKTFHASIVGCFTPNARHSA